jgi:hypothetical protein
MKSRRLSRRLHPAAHHGTPLGEFWLKRAGADVKDDRGQMRHSRATATLDIYQHFVPETIWEFHPSSRRPVRTSS